MAIDRVLLIEPRGFCAGVARAVKTVEEALDILGAPVYVKHEIVHNKVVSDELRSKGAIFVEDLSEVPEGSMCIFSAHGVSPAVVEQAKSRKLSTIDASCPLVAKIHIELDRFAKEGNEIIYIGHKGHPEAEGVIAIKPEMTHLVETAEDVKKVTVKDPKKLVYLTQTTLSVDECKAVVAALKEKFPSIKAPPSSDICYATTNRQTAIKNAATKCDVMLIIGSKNSSNSNRLVEAAQRIGTAAYLIDEPSDIKEEWFIGKHTLGISAGASAPERVVLETAEYFRERGAKIEALEGTKERMSFTMPYELNMLRKKDQ
jgi:4-hydroxy-3-methylbut-2-en-1-yl diphosphate reductase